MLTHVRVDVHVQMLNLSIIKNNYNLISKAIVHVAAYHTLIVNCDIVLLQIKNSSSCALMRLIIKLKIQDQFISINTQYLH